jgi:hypothetical protein
VRLKARQVLAREGVKIPDDKRIVEVPKAMKLIERWVLLDGTVPACCDECGDVEPDGKCGHGHPSVLMALGIIA